MSVLCLGEHVEVPVDGQIDIGHDRFQACRCFGEPRPRDEAPRFVLHHHRIGESIGGVNIQPGGGDILRAAQEQPDVSAVGLDHAYTFESIGRLRSGALLFTHLMVPCAPPKDSAALSTRGPGRARCPNG